MVDPSVNPPAAAPTPPPRAFTQGVGTVFQFAGASLFLVMMVICCGSGLLSPETARRPALEQVGWHLPGDPPGRPAYSGTMAITISVFGGIFFGLALSATGLGMQAEHRRAPAGAVLASGLAAAFWAIQTVFAATELRSLLLTLVGLGLVIGFAGLLGLAIAAVQEMRRNPPPPGHEVLPPDYRVPYSHMHQDPPEVRLERELAQRRQRLEVQQKELETLEERLKRRLRDKNGE
jgi:hypothetical protein